MTIPIFHRHALAKAIVDRVLSAKGMSGTFLSAPRRTGKSTLIKEDVVPLLEQRKVEVIYVDLWTDRDRDPSDLISEAVGAHLRRRESALLQWMRRGGLDKVKAGGIELDINKVGIGNGKTYARGLAELSDATGSMIVMVIDEAQHAATTKAGATALFSLKAARDELNSSAHHGFRLIATGSNRDKLNQLVQGRDQAFLGATTLPLEPLGRDFLEWELDMYAGAIRPSLDAAQRVFEKCGHRPEILRNALDHLELRSGTTPANVDAMLEETFDGVMREQRRAFLQQINSLPPLQAAVITVMARTGENFAPYRPHTMAMYEDECRRLTRDTVNVDDSAVQYALEALRDKSLVWKSARGVYAFEDAQHRAWLLEEDGSDARLSSQ